MNWGRQTTKIDCLRQARYFLEKGVSKGDKKWFGVDWWHIFLAHTITDKDQGARWNCSPEA
jgi:hypothetical protein